MVLQYALLSGGLTLFVEPIHFLSPAAYFDRTLQEIVTKTLFGSVAQSVTCWTADPGVKSSTRPGPILSWRLIMNFYGHSPLSADSRRVVISYK